MEILELRTRSDVNDDQKLEKVFKKFQTLLKELRKRKLPTDIVSSINDHINGINSIPDAGLGLKKQITTSQSKIIRLLEKELKIVPKTYYRATWMILGMSAIGIPLGAAFGVSQGNMAFIGIGMPIGMGIGIAIGTSMDKKAKEEGRQLDFDNS